MADFEVGAWDALGTRFYRKQEIYGSMLWEDAMVGGVDLRTMRCAAAAYGGPLALTLDPHKIVKVASGAATATANDVHIFTSAGARLALLKDNSGGGGGELVELGWTRDEALLCVYDDGRVRAFTSRGVALGERWLSADGGSAVRADGGVLAARIHARGLVALTAKLRFIALTFGGGAGVLGGCVACFKEEAGVALADAALETPPEAWLAVHDDEAAAGAGGGVALVATTTGTLLTVAADGVQDHLLKDGPFKRLAASRDGRLLALFNARGRLWATSADDLTLDLGAFETQSSVPPDQMAWVGTDAVAMHWRKLLLVVGVGAPGASDEATGAWIKYAYDAQAALLLVPELDGLRVVANDGVEWLSRVAASTERIFTVGSTAPAALLFDAADHFARQSPRADDIVRAIRDDLPAAVVACVDAALRHHLELAAQRRLLHAASFGRAFMSQPQQSTGGGGGGGASSSSASPSFARACRLLRVLNALAHYEVGAPVSFAQARALGDEALVARLAARHAHLLATRVARTLGLRADEVLVHWACAVVRHASGADADVCARIVRKLSGGAAAISYAEVASVAYTMGRTQLATRLLEHEPHAADQVPLLLRMSQDDVALAKAIESGDTDLVYLVVLSLKRTRPIADFFQVMRHKPLAMALLIKYTKSADRQLLKDMYYSAGRPGECANVAALDALALPADATEARVDALQRALDAYRESREHAFAARATEEHIRLLLLQKQLGDDFVQLSVGDTLYRLYAEADDERTRLAAKIAKEFKVPERRALYTRLRALSDQGDWPALEAMSREKKTSAIGFEPYVDACLAKQAPAHAAAYVPRVQNAERRFAYMLQLRMFREATDEARRVRQSARAAQLLEQVRQAAAQANDRAAVAYVDNAISER